MLPPGVPNPRPPLTVCRLLADITQCAEQMLYVAPAQARSVL